VDVLVAGGGPAGVAAALAAARAGRSVMVVDAQGCFGGMGTAGLLPVFMPFGDGVNFLAGGIGREIHDRLIAASGMEQPANPAEWCEPIHAEDLKLLYDKLVGESGAQFQFCTQLIAVQADGGRVTHAICAAKSGLFAFAAKTFVDATGDGDLCAWAAAPFEKGDADGAMMPGTLCSLWTKVDFARAGGSQESKLQQAIDDGVLSVPDRHLPGIFHIRRDLGGGNVGHTFGVDGTDERTLTAAFLHGRAILGEYERYYKQYLQGYEKMELMATAAAMGIRESRRILGDYVLCVEDFKTRAVFPDEIGRFAYPVDIHASQPDKAKYEQFLDEYHTLRYKPGESYGVPYRCLTPRGLDNVWVAGRCVSTDRYIQGSLRVMPGCYITGQACGLAAAMAVEAGTSNRDVNVPQLQKRLKAMGAYLPNA
jgi:hypothetical protein